MTDERTVKQLVNDATRDLSDIARAEVALAKAELRREVVHVGAAGGSFAAAAYLGYLLSITAVLTLAFLLAALGLPLWASFGVVTLVLAVIAGFLALVGRSQARKVSPPTTTAARIQETLAAVLPGRRRTASSPSGSADETVTPSPGSATP